MHWKRTGGDATIELKIDLRNRCRKYNARLCTGKFSGNERATDDGADGNRAKFFKPSRYYTTSCRPYWNVCAPIPTVIGRRCAIRNSTTARYHTESCACNSGPQLPAGRRRTRFLKSNKCPSPRARTKLISIRRLMSLLLSQHTAIQVQ